MDLKRTQQFIELTKHMDFTDILGFARIVGAQEQDSIEDFVSEICLKFNEMPRKKRKQLIQLAKDVVGANQDYDRYKESLSQGED